VKLRWLAVLATLVLALSFSVQAQPVVWKVFSDPSTGIDKAFCMCLSGNNIYIIGVENSSIGRIEVRDKNKGNLVKVWRGKGKFYTCTVANGTLYVGGGNVLAAFSLELSEKGRVKLDYAVMQVATDGEYLYIAGWKRLRGNDTAWVIEKRDPALKLVKRYLYNPSSGDEWAWGVGVNPATREVWVVGEFYNASKRLAAYEGRALILNRDLELRKELKIGGEAALAVAFDENGSAYILTTGDVLKLSKTGEKKAASSEELLPSWLLRPGRSLGFFEYVFFRALAEFSYSLFDNEDLYDFINRADFSLGCGIPLRGYFYLFSGELVDNRSKHVLYVYDENLKNIFSFTLGGEAERDYEFPTGLAVTDGLDLYVAGSDCVEREEGGETKYDCRWVVYALRPAFPVNVTSNAPVQLAGAGWYSPGETVRVTAPATVEAFPGVRYVFKMWKIEKPTGTASQANPSLELTVDAPVNLTAVYARQYMVEVAALSALLRSLVRGEGWYDEGAMATLSIWNTEVYFTGNVTQVYCTWGCSRALFEGWYKDGKLLSNNPSIVLLVNEPVKLEARWRVQHYVRVITDRGSAEGEGWYDDGSYATVKLTATEVDAGLVTYHFEKWEGLEAGDVIVERGTVKVLVNKPRSLVAVWREDYTRAYLLLGLLLAAVAVFAVKAKKRASGAR